MWIWITKRPANTDETWTWLERWRIRNRLDTASVRTAFPQVSLLLHSQKWSMFITGQKKNLVLLFFSMEVHFNAFAFHQCVYVTQAFEKFYNMNILATLQVLEGVALALALLAFFVLTDDFTSWYTDTSCKGLCWFLSVCTQNEKSQRSYGKQTPRSIHFIGQFLVIIQHAAVWLSIVNSVLFDAVVCGLHSTADNRTDKFILKMAACIIGSSKSSGASWWLWRKNQEVSSSDSHLQPQLHLLSDMRKLPGSGCLQKLSSFTPFVNRINWFIVFLFLQYSCIAG